MQRKHIGTQELENKIITILKPYGVMRVGIFGSFARGQERPDSDIDVLVEFSSRKTFFDIVGIEQELSETLGIKVDLLTDKAVNPYIADRIKKELVVIYE
ncbi:MAG: nucleotidyltransferase family protein [Nitrospirae bacterium YQR-1]